MMKNSKKTKTASYDKIGKSIKQNSIAVIDLKFSDMIGQWQHLSIMKNEFSKNILENGAGFDGSSIRGFKNIHESDMLLFPDPETAFIDPFAEHPTLSLICDIFDPTTRKRYTKDPRMISQNAENYLRTKGIADFSFFGPEPEFFILDSIKYDQTAYSGYYEINSEEGGMNCIAQKSQNSGHRPRLKQGYFPVSPIDRLQDIRTEMAIVLESVGIEVEVHHHEVASAGQTEIDMKRDTLTKMADKYLIFKYVTKNVAKNHGKTVTFMPKPIFGDNGSGMHVHQSLWKDGKPLFFGKEYAGLSKMALYYIGGLLKHAPALCAITNPTTNSYKRLVPGFEAPVNLVYSQQNRSASIRIPIYSSNPKSKRIEYRCPDSTCNPYLGFAALLMAGIDGIINKIDPGLSLDKDIYDLSPKELSAIPSTPASLEQALVALEKDHEFLLQGDVFSNDLIETWIDYKSKEAKQMQLRPNPYEFLLYYEV